MNVPNCLANYCKTSWDGPFTNATPTFIPVFSNSQYLHHSPISVDGKQIQHRYTHEPTYYNLNVSVLPLFSARTFLNCYRRFVTSCLLLWLPWKIFMASDTFPVVGQETKGLVQGRTNWVTPHFCVTFIHTIS